VVAASAVNGYISAPTRFSATRASIRVQTGAKPQAERKSVTIIDGFPEVVRGRAVFMNRDNLNTDGIYAGKWTYKDDLTREQMAAVIFENYDPNFRNIAKSGDIIVGGKNFGTGSSREQAATALKYFGIPCVIASTFSETYKRNAFNNGFVVFECPALVEYLRGKFADPKQLTAIGSEIEVNYRESAIRCDGKTFPFPPLSPVAQELVVAGGAEAVVAKRLKAC
jgi:homoaconitate hydratase